MNTDNHNQIRKTTKEGNSSICTSVCLIDFSNVFTPSAQTENKKKKNPRDFAAHHA